MHSFGVRAALSDKSRAFSFGDIPGFSSAVCLSKRTARQCREYLPAEPGPTLLVCCSRGWTHWALGQGLEPQVVPSLAPGLNLPSVSSFVSRASFSAAYVRELFRRQETVSSQRFAASVGLVQSLMACLLASQDLPGIPHQALWLPVSA